MKKTADPKAIMGSEGKARDRGGLRVLASTAPSMVRALNDAAFELTSETEAIPLDDDAGAAQPPIAAVTGRRSLAIRRRRVLAATNPGSREMVALPASEPLSAAPVATPEADTEGAPAVAPEPARPAQPVRLEPVALRETPAPTAAIEELAPSARSGGTPRHLLIGGLVVIGVVAGVIAALSGKASETPSATVSEPSAAELGPTATAAPAPTPTGVAPGPVEQDEAVLAPAPPEPSAPSTPPVAEASAPAVDEAPPAEPPPVEPPPAEAATPAEPPPVEPPPAEAATPAEPPPVDPPPAEAATREAQPAAAPAAAPAVAPTRSPHVKRVIAQRQKAYQREFEQRRRERLRAIAEQAKRNRAIARERKRRYKDDFKQRKRERLEATER